MNRPARPVSIAGTQAAYDPCPICGDMRIRHLAPPAYGCTAVRRPVLAMAPNLGSAAGELCDCPLDRDFPKGVI